MTKVKTIVMLDTRFFTENHRSELEKWLNTAITYDRYKVMLCEFPVADCGMIKSIEVGDKEA